MGLQNVMISTKALLPSPCPLTPHHSRLHSVMFPKETTLKLPQKPSPLFFNQILASLQCAAHTRGGTTHLGHVAHSEPDHSAKLPLVWCIPGTRLTGQSTRCTELEAQKFTKLPKIFVNNPQNWRGSPTTFTIGI